MADDGDRSAPADSRAPPMARAVPRRKPRFGRRPRRSPTRSSSRAGPASAAWPPSTPTGRAVRSRTAQSIPTTCRADRGPPSRRPPTAWSSWRAGSPARRRHVDVGTYTGPDDACRRRPASSGCPPEPRRRHDGIEGGVAGGALVRGSTTISFVATRPALAGRHVALRHPAAGAPPAARNRHRRDRRKCGSAPTSARRSNAGSVVAFAGLHRADLQGRQQPLSAGRGQP